MSELPPGDGVAAKARSAGVKYQPTEDSAICREVMGMCSTSSMGRGKAQCRPGLSRARSPSPTGRPRRRMTAFSCGPTVKSPEPRKTKASPTMTILTMKKLLRKASASACEPASSTGGGGAGGVGGGALGGVDGRMGSWGFISGLCSSAGRTHWGKRHWWRKTWSIVASGATAMGNCWRRARGWIFP